MLDYGFVKVAAAVPYVKVADCKYNAAAIGSLIKEACGKGVEVVVFPELSLTAYTCADLFHQERLLKGALESLELLLQETASIATVAVIGMPLSLDNQIFNCAVVIQGGEILGVVPKTYIPDYKEYYEERWFASGAQTLQKYIRIKQKEVPFGVDLLFQAKEHPDFCFGIEICEDLWVPIPPSSYQALGGATLLLNLSASNESIGKYEYRRDLVRQQSGRCIAGYVYASAGIGESTTDVVFGGHSIIAENGGVLAESERFRDESTLTITEIDVEKLASDRQKTTSFMGPDIHRRLGTGEQGAFRKIGFQIGVPGQALSRKFDRYPFVPSDEVNRDRRCEEIFAIQVNGLAKRLKHTEMKKAVIAISGGLDSTLALLVTVMAFDKLGISRKNIEGVTMPGFGTTGRTYNNALSLMRNLGVSVREIDIKPACLQHFKDIGHDAAILDVTYENVQARERTQILMDMANKNGGLVVGTGDLSELALGWCTYNGDHMSMYGVNAGIPKTLVKYLIRWVADHKTDEDTRTVLLDIMDTPISPELLPADSKGEIKQKTEDIIGPYELHDFFLFYVLRYGFRPKKILYLAGQAFDGSYDSQTIRKWLIAFYKRFFSQQFKRSCLPDGPKVGSVSLSPRGDWRMPSDACVSLWLEELQ